MVQFKRAYRFLLVLSSLGLFVYPGAAKMEIPDSLRIRIQKTKPDTSRVNLLNEMATDWMTRDLETAGLLSTEAVELARKSNYYRGLHKALMNRGNYLLYGARYSEARKDYQRALNLPVFIPQKEAAGIYDLLASASFLQGLYDSAIYFARQAVRRHRLDKGSEDYIRSLENLGSLFSQTGDYDSAILQYAKGVESIENNLRTLEVQTPAYKNALRQKAGMIRLIALSWYKKGNSRFANNELQKAIPMAVIGEDKGLEAKLYSDKAMIDHSSGMPEKALEYYLKALKIYEDNDESLQIAIIWSRIGDIYLGLGEFDNARRFYQQAIALHRKIGNKAGVAQLFNSLGDIHRMEKATDSAGYYYNESLKINKLLDTPTETGINYLNLGTLAATDHKTENALAYFREALRLFTEAGEKEWLTKASLEMGKYYLSNNELSKAETYLREALQNSEQNSGLSIKIPAALLLSEINERQGDLRNALYYHRQYAAFKDSLDQIEMRKQITQIQSAYDFEKQQNALEHEQEKSRNLRKSQQISKTLMYVSVVLVVMAGYIVYMFYRKGREKVRFEMEKADSDSEMARAQQALMQAEFRNKELESLRLMEELKFKTMNLTNLALILAQKNEFFHELRESLRELKTLPGPDKDRCVNELMMKLNQQGRVNRDLDRFRQEVDTANREFYEKLTALCPDLTQHDKELAGLLRIDLSSKEIASLHNISVKAVEMSRYRLRKKFGLEGNDNLVTFLKNMT